MARPPLPAIILGAAGLLPFFAGALAVHGMLPGVSSPFTGVLILQSYGAAILAFMGGCLWGFAARAGRTSWREMGFSVIPALWATSATFLPSALVTLMLGFVALFIIDLLFHRWHLCPDWWITLRLPLTIGVLVSLTAGVLL
ncbi:DUF3429 domain-containing protein [Algicella marina]|uniref:DUF3429 family protein n=1 Tax=Algicella marina TaxID=2683284 RepID=A0A6P1T709_9RHOB|nr:DUF3429 domain-containing protein [Algicella marina]QHQ37069.1 DUF3429 family protein [Algicella marina]